MSYDMNALLAWLGPAVDDLTPEQIERVADASRDIDQRYPGPDDQHRRDAALSATVQYLLGETSAEDARRERFATQLRRDEAYAAALQIAVMAVQDARATGASERMVDKKGKAEACGVDRMSLLKALGERP